MNFALKNIDSFTFLHLGVVQYRKFMRRVELHRVQLNTTKIISCTNVSLKSKDAEDSAHDHLLIQHLQSSLAVFEYLFMQPYYSLNCI